jgi:hypothetical protein
LRIADFRITRIPKTAGYDNLFRFYEEEIQVRKVRSFIVLQRRSVVDGRDFMIRDAFAAEVVVSKFYASWYDLRPRLAEAIGKRFTLIILIGLPGCIIYFS